jgi:hypothetical protein
MISTRMQELAGINERVITKFKTKVTLQVEILANATKHADDRKFRHEEAITDSEIRQSIVKATEDILQAFMEGAIKTGDKFLIYDPSNKDLNLVATFDMNEKGSPEKINIITIMRNKNFHEQGIKKRFKV